MMLMIAAFYITTAHIKSTSKFRLRLGGGGGGTVEKWQPTIYCNALAMLELNTISLDFTDT